MSEVQGRGSRASVDIIETPQVAPRRRGNQAAFIARNSGRMDETSDQVNSEYGSGTAVHTRPGTMPMYKPTERNGWLPRLVSVSALPLLMNQGWQEFCPDCNDHHLDRKGKITTDPNACKARTPVAVRVCPVCSKRVYDNMSLSTAVQEENDDPNVINDNAYEASSPEQRTKLKLDLHLWIRHPEWAQSNGVPPLPSAFKEMTDPLPTGKGT